MRAMDLPRNKDLMMPGPVGLKDEIEIQNVMGSYMESLESYMQTYYDNKGVIKQTEVLTKQEKAGLVEIKESINNKDWIVYTTEK